jgi:hypothetical protein
MKDAMEKNFLKLCFARTVVNQEAGMMAEPTDARDEARDVEPNNGLQGRQSGSVHWRHFSG